MSPFFFRAHPPVIFLPSAECRKDFPDSRNPALIPEGTIRLMYRSLPLWLQRYDKIGKKPNDVIKEFFLFAFLPKSIIFASPK